MEYILRPPFFVIKPHTRFSDAWEHFCKKLLRLDHKTSQIIRLRPPDLGADLIWQQKRTVYQCKSSEVESFNITKAKTSLSRALDNRKSLGEWNEYFLCLNMDLTGEQWKQLESIHSDFSNGKTTLSYLDKDYWIDLCKEYSSQVEEHFNVLIPASKAHIIEALEHEGYYPKYVNKYADAISKENFEIIVSTNRAEVKFKIPFSKTMTIKQLVDIMKGIIRLPKGWHLYPAFNSSATVNSVAITNDSTPQYFSKTLGELGIESGDELQFFIQVLWSDQLEKDGEEDKEGENRIFFLCKKMNFRDLNVHDTISSVKKLSAQEIKENTLKSFSITLHDNIWRAAKRIANQPKIT